jgi:hypothetical protein
MYNICMGHTQYYGGLIWTNHVLRRLDERGLHQEAVAQTFRYPDKSFKGKERDTTEFQKKFDYSTVTVIAKQNQNNEWLVLSAWVDPPVPGTRDAKKKDAYRAYQRAGFWGKLWRITLRQLGFTNF